MAVSFCVVGDSRSGTTLLQGLLALHPKITSVGEIRRLQDFIATGRRLCSCGQHVTQCEHWAAVIKAANLSDSEVVTQRPANRALQRFEEAFGLISIKMGMRPILPHGRRSADHVGRMLKAACEITNSDAVVDISKDPGHLVYMLRQQHVRVRPLFCMRDGRATVNSKIRGGFLPVETATRHWANVVRAMLWLRKAVGENNSDWIKYEDVCVDPIAAVSQIAANAGIHGDGFRLADRKPAHIIGGTKRFSMDTIKLDERWRTEMSDRDLATFERMAGKLNRSLGYL